MSKTSNTPLTPKQEKAIAALLAEPTVEKAATAAGVSKQTLYRWLDEPGFSAAFRRVRRQAFSHAISVTQRHLPRALNTLARIMMDKEVAASARVSAATALMKFGRESIELDDVVERVERLEANAAARERADSGRV